MGVREDGRFVPGYLGLALVDGYDDMGSFSTDILLNRLDFIPLLPQYMWVHHYRSSTGTDYFVCYIIGFAMSKPQMRANLESQLVTICAGQRSKDEVT